VDRTTPVTHYDNLKVARDAPVEVIRAAYRALAQQFHPDKFPHQTLAEQRMRIINKAYEVLCDPRQRSEHDAWIAEQEAQAAGPRREPGMAEWRLQEDDSPRAPSAANRPSPPESMARDQRLPGYRRAGGVQAFLGKLFRFTFKTAAWLAFGALALWLALKFTVGNTPVDTVVKDLISRGQETLTTGKLNTSPPVGRSRTHAALKQLSISYPKYDLEKQAFSGRIVNNSAYSVHAFTVEMQIFDCTEKCSVVLQRTFDFDIAIPPGQSRDFNSVPPGKPPVLTEVSPTIRGNGVLKWNIVAVSAD